MGTVAQRLKADKADLQIFLTVPKHDFDMVIFKLIYLSSKYFLFDFMKAEDINSSTNSGP